MDSSKSFVDREVRQILEGARSNLLQSGFWKFALEGTMVDPRFSWITAHDFAVDMEFKDQWHFINSENRLRLSSCWSATMLNADIGNTLPRSWDKLQATHAVTGSLCGKIRASSWKTCLHESYIEKVKRAARYKDDFRRKQKIRSVAVRQVHG